MDLLKNHKTVRFLMTNSEYDQEIHVPQSQIADKPMAPRGRAALMNSGMDSMKNDKTVRFLRNTGMDPLKNHTATHVLSQSEQCIVHNATGFQTQIECVEISSIISIASKAFRCMRIAILTRWFVPYASLWLGPLLHNLMFSLPLTICES